MFKKPFVIIDLETSGINPKESDIIEVAVLRYENGKEVERYTDLIRIDKPLDEIITIITGITDEALKEKGKDKDIVLKKVAQMIQGAYFVGHNVAFDAGFLKMNLVPMDVLGYLDTVQISQVLLPQAVSYSLESLTDDLAIEHKNSHRAMADVEATLELMKILWKRASELPRQALAEMQEVFPRSPWDGAAFFAEATSKGKAVTPVSPVAPVEISGAAMPSPITPQDMFGDGGSVNRHMENYEVRPQQKKMAETISHAFDQAYHLICEAPTGIGKSLAYLTAAADLAIRNKTKVVISTNTVNLQQQLYEKDVPLLQGMYRKETGHPGVRVALLKGRSHYLCLRRLAEFKRRPRLTEDEAILLGKILVWQTQDVTGDSSDINLGHREGLIWDFELSADQKYCTPQKCKAYGNCQLTEARKKAEESDILIVNHSLLCADLMAEGGLLPHYNYLVVDEAHHFEEVGTRAFGVAVKQETLSIPIKTIQNHLEDMKRRFSGTLFYSHDFFSHIDPLIDQIPSLQQNIQNFFDVISFFTSRNVPQSGFNESLLITPLLTASQEWLNLGDSLSEIYKKIEAWMADLRKFSSLLDATNSPDFPDRDDFTDELRQEVEAMSEQFNHARTFFTLEEKEIKKIRFITADMMGQVTVHMYPLMVGPILKEKLYDAKTSVILTSATLGVRLTQEGMEDSEQHPFTYIRQMLGLDSRFEELLLDSPFDFERQAYVITPGDLIPVVSKNSVQQVSDFMRGLITAVGGGILALFTSHGALSAVYLDVVQRLAKRDVKILAQRLSGGRAKIMKAYLNDPSHSVLFGTSSFWEGIDIQGEALTTLVIHKLPFDVPSDPIHAVRGQMFQNGFMEYSVPRAILRFRQGFGRLVRSQRDYGVMILLDDRVLKKDYGKMFLQALPTGITVEKHPLKDVPEKVGEWLRLMKN